MTSTEKSTNSVLRRDAARELLHAYRGHFDESTGADARKRNYQTLVNSFYDLVTDCYRFGWGDSFHFAPRRNGEKFRDSLARCERFFADALDLSAGMKVLDVGCGVGGPMREIARHSGAHVVGLNNHAYQLEKAHEESHRKGQDSLCTLLHGDFMSIPVADGSFDAAYSIEATPHAPDKQGVFDEVFRILKPGGEFAGFEWCLTDGFDPETANTAGSSRASRSAMACLNWRQPGTSLTPFYKPDSNSPRHATRRLTATPRHRSTARYRDATSPWQACREHPSAAFLPTA